MVQTVHPDPALLSDLLLGNLPGPQQAGVIQHLDTCETCQITLESLAAAGSPVAVPHEQRVDPVSRNSAFWPAVERLREFSLDVTQSEVTTSDSSIDFLDPPVHPGELGRLENFEVIELIGRGGMGLVLKAFDACLHRYVAIKVLAPTTATNENARMRFLREVRAAAAIRHENVVAIHTIDEARGQRPYLVMEYVPGMSLEQRLATGRPLELEEILDYGSQIAAGLAAAHAQGLIHRDVKPGNILLEAGVNRVKITDFGLARAVEDGRLTQTGLVVGTPQYMAPEQAQGEGLDHRADLFSLGSVLYAMATGQPPFSASSTMGVLLAVYKDRPRAIQEINPSIPEWLVAVIDKLHAKNPAERYQTASEVAELLGQSHCQLQGWRPSTEIAVPPSTSSAGGWGARFAGFLGSLLGRSESAAPVGASTASAEVKPTPLPPRASLDGNTGPVWSIAYSPDGTTLAMAIDNNTVKLWDPAARRVRATLSSHLGPVWSVAFSPDSTRMATGSDDGIVKLWDPTTGRELTELLHSTSVRSVVLSSDGKTLVSGTRDGRVHVWDLDSGAERIMSGMHGGVTLSVAISSDGRTIASASADKTIKLWDAATGIEQLTLLGHVGGVHTVAFSPDNTTLASGGWDKSVTLWDVATGNKLSTFQGHLQDVWAVAFAPGGRVLASASEDRTVRLWEVASGRELAKYEGHNGTIYGLAFSRDGQTIASGSRDGTVKLWDALLS